MKIKPIYRLLPLLFVQSLLLYGDFNSYHFSTLEKIVQKNAQLIEESKSSDDSIQTVLFHGIERFRVVARFVNQFKPLSDQHRYVIENVCTMTNNQAMKTVLKNEVKIKDGDTVYWLPIQEQLVEHIKTEIDDNGLCVLFVTYLGTIDSVHTITINEFHNLTYDDLPPNSFFKFSNTLGFTLDQYNQIHVPVYLSCLRIGDIYIGQNRIELFNILGEPVKRISEDSDSSLYVFSIESMELELPYWTITIVSDTVETIQLTGKNPNQELDFSGLQLGDHKMKLVKYFGEPVRKKTIDEIHGILWDYYPFPISFELVNDRMFSIRISRFSGH